MSDLTSTDDVSSWGYLCLNNIGFLIKDRPFPALEEVSPAAVAVEQPAAPTATAPARKPRSGKGRVAAAPRRASSAAVVRERVASPAGVVKEARKASERWGFAERKMLFHLWGQQVPYKTVCEVLVKRTKQACRLQIMHGRVDGSIRLVATARVRVEIEEAAEAARKAAEEAREEAHAATLLLAAVGE